MQKIELLEKEISKKVIGQKEMIQKILIGIFTGNHILLEGLPGLAKSLTINTVAETLGLSFSRIQFTPDLLPSDIVGTEIYNEKNGEFHVKKGPIFANIVFATQNPIEQDGTYPLPEAQQDRFLMKVKIEYPTWDEEFKILDLLTSE